jgi:hypothetical protein
MFPYLHAQQGNVLLRQRRSRAVDDIPQQLRMPCWLLAAPLPPAARRA